VALSSFKDAKLFSTVFFHDPLSSPLTFNFCNSAAILPFASVLFEMEVGGGVILHGNNVQQLDSANEAIIKLKFVVLMVWWFVFLFTVLLLCFFAQWK
jgi:hypothetical protein